MSVESMELGRRRSRDVAAVATGIPISDRLRLQRHQSGLVACQLAAGFLASPLFRWRFASGRAEKLLVAPQDLHTADPTFASDVLSGRFIFAGTSADIGVHSPFEIDAPNREWAAELHGFGWLRHLRAADTAVARAQATSLVGDWMAMCPIREGRGWSPLVTARRLISWTCHSPIILDQADHAFYRRFLRSLMYQSRYLRGLAIALPDGAPRITAAVALCHVGLCIAGQNRLLKSATRRLEDEIERQILTDGGTISREPSDIITLLLDFLPVRQTFTARSIQPPDPLVAAIERMMPMTRFFRLGDGEVANFNGAQPFYPDEVGTVLAYDDARGRPVMNALYSGYQRIEADDTVVVMDAGKPPALGLSSQAHAGCLSFELSTGQHRLIVNCGQPRTQIEKWRQVARETAAHSTACLLGQSSCVFANDDGDELSVGEEIVAGPNAVPVKRSDTAEGTIIDASHDGYKARLGIVHQRRIVLDKAGTCLQGEDRFHAEMESKAAERGRFALRFHLHPAVRTASLDARRALLILPTGEGWVFSGFDSPISIEDSVYLADPRGPMRAQQIVFDGRCSIIPSVSWEIRKVRSSEEIVELLERLEEDTDAEASDDETFVGTD